MHTDLQSEISLRRASDLFVTFLYAAAVHLVIAHLAAPGPMIPWVSVLTLLFVLFLFSDWLSRVRLPWLLPSDDEVGVVNQLAKTSLEVCGLFFLVLSGLTAVEIFVEYAQNGNHSPHLDFWSVLHPYVAFSAFLVFTFVWNLLILKVMRELTWWNLVGMTVNGSALEPPEKGRQYAKRFWELRDRLEMRARSNSQIDTGKAWSNFELALPSVLLEACVRNGAQIVTIHVAFTNILAAIIIFAGHVAFDNKPVVTGVRQYLGTVNLPGGIAKLLTWAPSETTSIVVSVVMLIILLVFVLFALRFIFLERHHGRKVLIFHVTVFLILLSTFSLRALSWFVTALELPSKVISTIVLIVGFPVLIFVVASQFEKRKKLMLRIGGVIGFALVLGLYLAVRPILLLAIVAVQQVAVNIFLQYVASEQPIIVRISPLVIVLRKGEQQKFSVTVTGTDKKDVGWEAARGTIDRTGTSTALFTAPMTAGVFTIGATLIEHENQFAQATVTVVD